MKLATKISLISAFSEMAIQRRPLVSVEVAAYLRDESPDCIREQTENGKLVCFDLRSKNSNARGLVRILARSLKGPVTEAEVYCWIPNFNPTASQLPRLLGVSPEHVRSLLSIGLLKQIGKPSHAKESPHIERESLLGFLKSRRIGAPSKPLPQRPFSTNARCAKSSYALHTVLKRGVAK